MGKQKILNKSKDFIRKTLLTEGTGHDYFHVERVVANCKKILARENADGFLVELSAWLHDVGDHKLNGGIDKSKELITEFLQSMNVDKEIIDSVVRIVSQVSYSKGNVPTTLEAKIVQDADRLDAIGAIGIARCFAYGGSVGNILYNPEDNSKNSSSIQHFYDKLFNIKNLINTPTAKLIAEEKHAYMENFVKQFYNEINA